MKASKTLWVALLCAAVPALAADAICPRPQIGDSVTAPDNLRSSNGHLRVEFSMRTSVGQYGLTRYCYIDSNGLQAPTLRVQQGDELIISLRNDLPAATPASQTEHVHQKSASSCSSGPMSASATNLHFHGMDLPPTCHQDETLRTLIQPAAAPFEYRVKIPIDEPPGLYWYHPHPHGYSEPQVLGGASGALIVEGIEQVDTRVAGLSERVLVLRDQRVPGLGEADEDAGPGKDISLNFVPIMHPLKRPAQMAVPPATREFWRVLNAAADTYFDLQVRFGQTIQDVHEVQPLDLVAIDGAPIGAQAPPKISHVLLPPGARAEFILTTPGRGVIGQLVTLAYDTGKDGSAHPYRAIANIFAAPEATAALPVAAAATTRPRPAADMRSIHPAHERKLYFSERREKPDDPNSPVSYFITVEGAVPKIFDMNFTEPDITARQGTVEDWIIENRAEDAHAFHIHQLHFQVLERDGQKMNEALLRDTVDLPPWDGKSTQYPSVKLRMDFRNPDIVGTFVYHCHILEHEDGGMMGAIRVLPARQ